MDNDIVKKIVSRKSLTDEEANIFLLSICNEIRKDCNISDPMSSDCKVCFDTSRKFGIIVYANFGCDVDMLNIREKLEIPLTHYANFISLNINGCMKIYLVDMTYSQFFGDTITLDENKENYGRVVSTQNVFGKIEKEPFVLQLRQNGFIELNNTILKKYIDAFLDLCEVKSKEQAYYNVNKLLTKNEYDLVVKTNSR